MIDFKQKIINNVHGEYKNLIQKCSVEIWENRTSVDKEFMLNIYGQDEIIKELFENEFDYILLKIFSNYNFVFINFNSVEADELEEILDDDEEKQINQYRKNLEQLYNNE